MRAAAFLPNSNWHLLDHLAPLADWLNIPLICSEGDSFSQLKTYYPFVNGRFLPNLELEWQEITEEFNTLFGCAHWPASLKWLCKEVWGKSVDFILCPHGQSDKGFLSPLLASYIGQDGILMYGPLMKQMLKRLGIWKEVAQWAEIGNLRYRFYLKYRSFYDELIDREVFSKLPQKKTLLYAPTWDDRESSTSFFQESLFKHIPSDWNVIIKPHPHLESFCPERYFPLLGSFQKKRTVFLLDKMPLIYPLLSRIDAYLGDSSSIGYDCLTFLKPLFFLNPHTSLPLTHPSRRLHRCGICLETGEESSLFSLLPEAAKYIPHQKNLYAEAFGSDCPSLHSKGGKIHTSLNWSKSVATGRASSS